MSKILKWYICRDRKIENHFRNCLIFRENKLFFTKFREQIIYYTPIIKLYILMHSMDMWLVEIIREHPNLGSSFHRVANLKIPNIFSGKFASTVATNYIMNKGRSSLHFDKLSHV